MAWTSVRLRSAGADAEALSEALEALGAEAVTLEPASDELLFHDPLMPGEAAWSRMFVSALFPGLLSPAEVASRLAEGHIDDREYETGLIEDRDWEASVRGHFAPLHFPPRLWVYPSWHKPPVDDAVQVEIDPGLAFGTGVHATTGLCLEWLSRSAGDLAGVSVIDYGCGSGILAIAALRLGGSHATAVDIDPQALVVAADNARRNGVADAMQCVRPGARMASAAIVFANILAGPLVALAPALTELTCDQGVLLLSGFIESQEPGVRAAFPGFRFQRFCRDGWILLVGRKDR